MITDEKGCRIYGRESRDGMLMRSPHYPDQAIWASPFELAAMAVGAMQVDWFDPYPSIQVTMQQNPAWDATWSGDLHVDGRTGRTTYRRVPEKFNEFVKSWQNLTLTKTLSTI